MTDPELIRVGLGMDQPCLFDPPKVKMEPAAPAPSAATRPEIVAAVRAGAVNLVADMVEEELATMRRKLTAMQHNRDQWRAFAYEAKAKLIRLVAIQAEMNQRFVKLRVEADNVKTWTHATDAWDEGWLDAMIRVGHILEGLEDE